MAWNLTGTARDVRAARACAPSDAPDGEGAPRALSVSEAMGFAKGALESRTLVVEGEVSEFNDKPGYKAAYFTIADASSPMSCMMWRNRYLASGVELRVGEKVRVTGRFTVYVPKGRMQFEVFSLAPAGEGDLRQRVDRLARKLEAQGLMDPARKRPIPRFCQRVAVVTSPRGKAVHDVMRTLRRRNPLVELLVCGVAVEGADAPAHIIEGLRVAAQARPDAILLVRGGGSYEDLMPFNDEQLARAVAACPVPVVTGIGHEPDTTICDMVGDLRCSTPTAAAESRCPLVPRSSPRSCASWARASGPPCTRTWAGARRRSTRSRRVRCSPSPRARSSSPLLSRWTSRTTGSSARSPTPSRRVARAA